MAIRQQDGNIYCLAAILSEICPTESLSSVIRHAIKKRKVFPTDEAVKKLCGWQSSLRPRNGRCR